MHTILVVDDERRIAEIARDYLVRAGFSVIVSAMARARSNWRARAGPI